MQPTLSAVLPAQHTLLVLRHVRNKGARSSLCEFETSRPWVLMPGCCLPPRMLEVPGIVPGVPLESSLQNAPQL